MFLIGVAQASSLCFVTCQNMVGAWRSLVAHTLGVRVVAGSNPAAPTNKTVNKFRVFRIPN